MLFFSLFSISGVEWPNGRWLCDVAICLAFFMHFCFCRDYFLAGLWNKKMCCLLCCVFLIPSCWLDMRPLLSIDTLPVILCVVVSTCTCVSPSVYNWPIQCLWLVAAHLPICGSIDGRVANDPSILLRDLTDHFADSVGTHGSFRRSRSDNVYSSWRHPGLEGNAASSPWCRMVRCAVVQCCSSGCAAVVLVQGWCPLTVLHGSLSHVPCVFSL